MTSDVDDISKVVVCDRCGYDLRAQPTGGVCPECGASVAESVRLAAIPRRPAWRDSDPRWRRRMLAGVWLLVLMPLMDVLQLSDSAMETTLPTIFDNRGAVTLGQTFLVMMRVYPQAIFCMGVVLLFATEHGRRASRLDWTRRWGILCSYVTALLLAAPILFISSLVMVGIAALFISMVPKDQPRVTRLFVELSRAYLRYGPQPGYAAYYVVVAFSSITVLLACVPLFNALRSIGLRLLALLLPAPLAVFAVVQIVQAGWFGFGVFGATNYEFDQYGAYFRPDLLVPTVARVFTGVSGGIGWNLYSLQFGVEAAKWCIVFTIAVWLSIAQLASRRRTGDVQS